MSIRDLRKKARTSLHTAMSVPAVYHSKDRSLALACTVRVHHKQAGFGDMTGFDYAPAERITIVPEIVVLAEEVSPSRGGVFSLAADEAYQVEVAFPRDGLTITAQVTRMSAKDLENEDPTLTFPEPT